MHYHWRRIYLLLTLLLPICAEGQWDDSRLKPYVMDHRHGLNSAVNLSFLHDAPAGKSGFIRVQDGHFVKPDGTRIRFWGVHLTDWSPGSVMLPPKQDIPMWAETLSRFGVNLVRLHFLDLSAPRGIIAAEGNDTRALDPQQLDRLDYLVSELKKRGIYVDLNLNVGRSYKAGDGVADFDKIRWAKGLILFDRRLMDLEKEYAKAILTHVNSYTGYEYRNEPSMAIVEILNENGIGVGFRSPSAYYDDELTRLYNAWLPANLSAGELKKLRDGAGTAADSPVSRLKASEVASAQEDRYRAEVSFYMKLESDFYGEMSGYLKNTLGIKAPIIGTSDHGHTGSSYPMLTSLSKLDIMDGHIYWEHPEAPPPVNSPMVNDPLHSTVVQLSRTAVAGKPYTVTETNHPFPNEWASEGIPIIAAYGSFQDWDAIITYTFEPKLAADWKPYIGDAFDISLDPVRMTEFAAGALTFLRGDVHAARQTAERSYSADQVVDSRRLPHEEEPYFTPGFQLELPLEHEVRIQSLNGLPTAPVASVAASSAILSDTGELSWYKSAERGVVAVNTDRTQALIGFLKPNAQVLKNMSVDLTNTFATIVLTSMESSSIAESRKLLLTTGSRVANTGMKWNDAHTKLLDGGTSPTLIEPVAGNLVLRNLKGAKRVSAFALNGSGCRMGEKIQAQQKPEGWILPLGKLPTPWYVVLVER